MIILSVVLGVTALVGSIMYYKSKNSGCLTQCRYYLVALESELKLFVRDLSDLLKELLQIHLFFFVCLLQSSHTVFKGVLFCSQINYSIGIMITLFTFRSKGLLRIQECQGCPH